MKIENSFILMTFADHNSNVTQIIGLTIHKLKNGGARRKADYHDFLISTVISKGLLHSILRCPICVVKDKLMHQLCLSLAKFCQFGHIHSKSPFFQYSFCF